MVNNIKTFDERVEELVKLGKEQDYLTYEQIAKKTIDLELDSESLDMLYNVLTENNIEDYSNKIIEIMNNKKLYNKVSKNCFNDLYTNWDKKVKEMYTKYKQLINKE